MLKKYLRERLTYPVTNETKALDDYIKQYVKASKSRSPKGMAKAEELGEKIEYLLKVFYEGR